MILEQNRQAIETNISNQAKTFTIEANAEMFHMLSSGLYTNKIKAVVRELSTNAVDAMIAKGTIQDKQFEVHLPTALEPFFGVRDFGVGLTEKEVYELYTSYGASNKRESNLFNGALGVGSKSPFAYTDTFNIVSYKDGKAMSFVAFLEDFEPKITKISEKETEEHDGLFVSLPVKKEDAYTFRQEAIEVYKWFEHRPKLNVELEIPDMYAKFGKRNWFIDENVRSYDRFITVVMANVAYRVNKSDLPDNFEALASLANIGLVIKVPTGAVRMAASRESLSLTKTTLENLKEILKKVSQELEEGIEERIMESEEVLTKKLADLATQVRFFPEAYRERITQSIIQKLLKKEKISNFQFLKANGSTLYLNNYYSVPKNTSRKKTPVVILPMTMRIKHSGRSTFQNGSKTCGLSNIARIFVIDTKTLSNKAIEKVSQKYDKELALRFESKEVQNRIVKLLKKHTDIPIYLTSELIEKYNITANKRLPRGTKSVKPTGVYYGIGKNTPTVQAEELEKTRLIVYIPTHTGYITDEAFNVPKNNCKPEHYVSVLSSHIFKDAVAKAYGLKFSSYDRRDIIFITIQKTMKNEIKKWDVSCPVVSLEAAIKKIKKLEVPISAFPEMVKGTLESLTNYHSLTRYKEIIVKHFPEMIEVFEYGEKIDIRSYEQSRWSGSYESRVKKPYEAVVNMASSFYNHKIELSTNLFDKKEVKKFSKVFRKMEKIKSFCFRNPNANGLRLLVAFGAAMKGKPDFFADLAEAGA